MEEDNFRNLIHYKIDELRIRLGLTWEEFAFRTGLKKRALLRISAGGLYYIPIRSLIIIARTCGVRSFSELIEIRTSHLLSILAPKLQNIEPRRVVFHVASTMQEPVRGSTGSAREGAGINRERCGVWDIRATSYMMREMFRQFRYIEPDLIDSASDIDARRIEEDAKELLKRTRTERILRVIVGSTLASGISEGVVASAFGQTPFVSTEASRAAFPYTVQWISECAPDSAFGLAVDDPAKAGIVDTRTGKLVARFELVGDGEGEDCALIMALRSLDPTDPSRDGGVLLVLLGYGGPATFVAARMSVDPNYAHELYPPEPDVPLMRAVRVTYKRQVRAPGDMRDTRIVTGFSLVPLSASDDSSEVAAA